MKKLLIVMTGLVASLTAADGMEEQSKSARVLKIMAEIEGTKSMIDRCSVGNKDYNKDFAEFMALKNPYHIEIRLKKIAEYEVQLNQLLAQ